MLKVVLSMSLLSFAHGEDQPHFVAFGGLDEEQQLIYHLLQSRNGLQGLYDWRVRPRGQLPEKVQPRLLPSHGNSRGAKLDAFDYGDYRVLEKDEQVKEEEDKDAGQDEFKAPLDVDVNMYLRSISKVDDANMEYTLHFSFRQEWTDERLRFESSRLGYIALSPSDERQRIFLPDTFFQNEKAGRKHIVDKPNIMIRIFNGSGKVLYSTRLTLTFSCPMFLDAFPLDAQTCYLDFASYAYTVDDLRYHWARETPVQLKPGLHHSLPSFRLSSIRTSTCISVTNTGSYSCLRLILSLKREFSYYLLQLYIPSFMLVTVSTLSFWIDKDSVPARVTLGTTVLLTVTAMSAGISANLPPVSYTKSVDIWIGVCTAFIFGALLEFAFVNWAAMQEAASKHKRTIRNPLLASVGRARALASLHAEFKNHHRADTSEHSLSLRELVNFDKRAATKSCMPRRWHIQHRPRSQRIDLLSRILFPLFFLVFNIIVSFILWYTP